MDEGNDLETAEQVSLLGTRFLGVSVRSTAGVVPDSLLCRVFNCVSSFRSAVSTSRQNDFRKQMP